MIHRRKLRTFAARTALALAIVLGEMEGSPGLRAEPGKKELLSFAAEMAKRGNWREAKYRWLQALAQEPDSPRIHNNLAVSFEALGQVDDARMHYEKAEVLAPGDTRIEDNRLQFDRFWREAGARADGEQPSMTAVAQGDDSAGGKKLKVSIQLPVPARMDLTGIRTLLVASFVAPDSPLLDINRELVRFLRSEFRKHTPLEVLDVTPPPAVPEQTLEDLIRNAEFWKHLGREYDADLLVTGTVRYTSRDYSGFRDVDRVNPTTGQKVRRSEFVEQEKFEYVLELLFFSGETGELKFRDRIQREAVFQGTANDPITAFFEMSESMAPDLLAIVRPRTREASRIIFVK